ncbi:hypothetical protein GCM10025770_20710 [Viridibacterium curvum]|uniref:Uncharacterized protein n=1 Tax=Viridibacterium curvum TaxID=1101404 RepID=A0ABP9QPB5_9RHOO
MGTISTAAARKMAVWLSMRDSGGWCTGRLSAIITVVPANFTFGFAAFRSPPPLAGEGLGERATGTQ